MVACNLPKCRHCGKILRPNVSMFGDYEFYGKPYEYSKKKMDSWITKIKNNNKKLAILEIGCGTNQHSLRMNNGVMMSGEWKIPKIKNLIKTVRINLDDCNDWENPAKETVNLSMKAKDAIRQIFL